MATSLAEIRAKLQASENRQGGGSQTGGDSAIYAHWNIAEGTTSVLDFSQTQTQKTHFSGSNDL